MGEEHNQSESLVSGRKKIRREPDKIPRGESKGLSFGWCPSSLCSGSIGELKKRERLIEPRG